MTQFPGPKNEKNDDFRAQENIGPIGLEGGSNVFWGNLELRFA